MSNPKSSMSKKLKRLIRFMQDENLFTLLLVIFSIVLLSSLSMSFLEPNLSFVSAVWWSIVTLTTVGYGDISPATVGGRVVAVLIMFFGIGLLGMLSASLAAIFISQRMKENKGMCSSEFTDHIILCEWNHRARSILKELRGDSKTEAASIVLIADIEEKPVDDNNLFFIRGPICEETLEKANLEKASTVVVLGDDALDTMARDAKVVLSTLTIESMCSDVYTVVELVDKNNERHCLRANADEVIVGSELSSHLIATAAIDHGISRIISELLSTTYGNEIYSMPVPKELVGKNFLEILVTLKKENQATVLAVQRGAGGPLTTNPDNDYTLDRQDYLIVISKDRPKR